MSAEGWDGGAGWGGGAGRGGGAGWGGQAARRQQGAPGIEADKARVFQPFRYSSWLQWLQCKTRAVELVQVVGEVL